MIFSKKQLSSVQRNELILLLIFTLSSSGSALQSNLAYSIDESTNINAFVGNVRIDSNADEGLQANQRESIQFMILTNNDLASRLFKIDSTSGQLRVAREIDYDDPNLCNGEPCFVYIEISIHPESLGGLVKIKIQIRDINDNSPVFATAQKVISIPEDRMQFQTMLDKATDRDNGVNGQVRHTLVEESGTFSLTEQMDMLFLNLKSGVMLDFETKKLFVATLQACDSGAPSPRCTNQQLSIQVEDSNDNSPQVMGSAIINVNIREDYPKNQPIVRINATDADSGENARLSFRISSSASDRVKSTFRVNADHGLMYLWDRLNAQQSDYYDVPILIQDHGANPRVARATVNIRVQDVNDHSPVVSVNAVGERGTQGRIEVVENALAGQSIAFVVASDGDLNENAHIRCTLPSAHAELFSLEQQGERGRTSVTYKLKTRVQFDYEQKQSIGIEVRCTDSGIPALSTAFKVEVGIMNENEFAPQFQAPTGGYKARVMEGKVNERVCTVTATDNDTNSVVTYALDEAAADKFSIDSSSGTIFTKLELDREATAQFNIQVLAIDNADSYRPKVKRTVTTQVFVEVLDANDNAPFLLTPHLYKIEEGQPAQSQLRGGPNDQGRLVAEDRDIGENGRVDFEIVEVRGGSGGGLLATNFGNSTFAVGLGGQLRSTKVLDREQVPSYLVKVRVFDHAKLFERKSVTVTITVSVLDLDDESPIWTFPRNSDNWVNITTSQRVGEEVTRVEATDPDTSSNLTYTLIRDNAYFKVEQTSGKVYVAKELHAGQHELHLRVDDNAMPINHFEEVRLYINVYGVSGIAHSMNDVRINLTIIVTMVVITAVISIALVTAIVCVRKRTLSPPMGSYMASELSKIDSPYQCHCPDENCGVGQHAGSMVQREPVYHQLCTSPPPLDRLYPLSTFSSSGGSGAGSTIDRTYNFMTTNQKPPSLNQLQSIQGNEVLINNNLDLDEESADSGRGGSEEGGNSAAALEHRALHSTSTYVHSLDNSIVSPVSMTARPFSRTGQRIGYANLMSPGSMTSSNSGANCRCHILPEGEVVQSSGCVCGSCAQDQSMPPPLSLANSYNNNFVSNYQRLQERQPPSYASLPRHSLASSTNAQCSYMSQSTLPRRALSPEAQILRLPPPPSCLVSHTSSHNSVTNAYDVTPAKLNITNSNGRL